MILRVDDPGDPRVAAFRQVRERNLVGRQGRFMAEGEVVLRKLVRSPRHAAEAVLVAETRLAGLADVIAELGPDAVVYAAGQAVMDAVAGFPIHRGVLAVGRRIETPGAAALLRALPPRAVAVGLIAIANHDNMGGIFRNAAAFGAGAVILDATCCDPLYRKAIRVSAGAALDVPFARLGEGEDMIAAFEWAGLVPLALTPAGGETLSGLIPPPRAALLLGAEGPGLPGEVLARARSLCIPMVEGFDSLNVAVAAGIALHHLRTAAVA